jgi:hypothetical protein
VRSGGVWVRREPRVLTLAATCAAALAAGCIGLDFVEPNARTQARFLGSLAVDSGAVAWIRLQAGLLPPGDGVEPVALPDSALRVGDVRLRPFEISARNGYVWRDSLRATRPGSLVVQPPEVPGVAVPPRIRVSLYADVPPTPAPTWTPGGDLRLPLPDAPTLADVPEAWTWTLSVTGWLRDGQRAQLVGVRSWADPGEALQVPGALFPPLELDSLEARWQCSTTYATSAADSSYVAEVAVEQTVVWRVAVTPPAAVDDPRAP